MRYIVCISLALTGQCFLSAPESARIVFRKKCVTVCVAVELLCSLLFRCVLQCELFVQCVMQWACWLSGCGVVCVTLRMFFFRNLGWTGCAVVCDSLWVQHRWLGTGCNAADAHGTQVGSRNSKSCALWPRLIPGSPMYGQLWQDCSWMDTKEQKPEMTRGWETWQTWVGPGVCHWLGHNRYPNVCPGWNQPNFGKQPWLRINGGETCSNTAIQRLPRQCGVVDGEIGWHQPRWPIG